MVIAINDLNALEGGNIETLDRILKSDGPLNDNLDAMLLIKAIAMNSPGWEDIIKKLLERGCRVTNTDNTGVTALHFAFYTGASTCIIELLLNRFLQETKVDLKSKDGLGCLHITCAKASIDMVKRCLVISNVNAQVSSTCGHLFAGYAPLHFAVAYDRFDVADFLCQNNADIYVRDASGSTPIHLALERRNVEMLDILFQYDKKYINCANRYGITHFMAACAGRNSLIVEQYLRTADDEPSTSSETLITAQVPELINYPFAGYSAFYFAVEFFSKNLQLLFNRGAYCKLEKLLPINLNCHMQRGLVFALIQNHYINCQICGRMNWLYKLLACSNSGIMILNGARREECAKGNFMTVGFVFGSVMLFIVVFLVIMAQLQ